MPQCHKMVGPADWARQCTITGPDLIEDDGRFWCRKHVPKRIAMDAPGGDYLREGALRAAYDWLLAAPIQEGRRFSHLGLFLGRFDLGQGANVTVGLMPKSYSNQGVIFAFYDLERNGIRAGHAPGVGGLTEQEVAKLRALVERVAGEGPHSEWNGVGYDGVSLQVRATPGPGVTQGLELYRKCDPFSEDGPPFMEVPDFAAIEQAPDEGPKAGRRGA